MLCEHFFPFPPSPDNEKGSPIIIHIIIFGEICLDCLSLPPLTLPSNEKTQSHAL